MPRLSEHILVEVKARMTNDFLESPRGKIQSLKHRNQGRNFSCGKPVQSNDPEIVCSSVQPLFNLLHYIHVFVVDKTDIYVNYPLGL